MNSIGITTISENAPGWDGGQPQTFWRDKKREIVQWRDDMAITVPKEMLGTKLYRSISGDARRLIQDIPDNSELCAMDFEFLAPLAWSLKLLEGSWKPRGS